MINFNETEKLMLRRLGQEKTGYYLFITNSNQHKMITGIS